MTVQPRENSVAPNEALCLPPAYRQRPGNETLDTHRADDNEYWSAWRIDKSRVYQRHVYLWAAELIRRRGHASVLDIGCGVGTKLREIIAPVCPDLTGMDQASAVAKACELGTTATLIAVDLEAGGVDLGRTFDLIICADVLEHLGDPRPTMDLIRRCSHPGTDILLSTPDRRRRRGRTNMGSDKPEHVREWSRAEFCRYVESSGFRVRRSRLTPQDDSSPRGHVLSELKWRVGLGAASTLACNAVLCRAA